MGSRVPLKFATAILVFDDGLVIDRVSSKLDMVLGLGAVVPHSFLLRAGAKQLRFGKTEEKLGRIPREASFRSPEVIEYFPNASYCAIDEVNYAVIVSLGRGTPGASVRFNLAGIHTDLFDISPSSVGDAKNLLSSVLGDRLQDETNVSIWSNLASGWRCRVTFEVYFETIPGEEIYLLMLGSDELPSPIKLSWSVGHIWRKELVVPNEHESGDVTYCYGYRPAVGPLDRRFWERGVHCRPFPSARSFIFRDAWIGVRPGNA